MKKLVAVLSLIVMGLSGCYIHGHDHDRGRHHDRDRGHHHDKDRHDHRGGDYHR
jgi:hypothetical protein